MTARFSAALVCVVAMGAQAQAFKCQINGRVEYRDAPCPDAQQTQPLGNLNTNTIRGIPRQADRAAAPAPGMSIVGGPGALPSEQDAKNLETAASSVTTRRDTALLHDEARRIRIALQYGGTYTRADWDRLKQLAEEGGTAARREAERIHLEKGSAEAKADVMHSMQAASDRPRRADAPAPAPTTAAPAADYDRLQSCSGGRCTGQSGDTYQQVPGTNRFDRNDGKRCDRNATTGQLTCY